MTTRTVTAESPPGWVMALKDSADEIVAATVHYDTDESLAATLEAVPAATDLGTSVTLGVALTTAWAAHIASTACHAVADSTNGVGAAAVTNLATLETWLAEFKTDFHAHAVDTTYHRNREVLRLVAPDPSTDQTAANLLANECQRVLCAHLRNGAQTLPTCYVGGVS